MKTQIYPPPEHKGGMSLLLIIGVIAFTGIGIYLLTRKKSDNGTEEEK